MQWQASWTQAVIDIGVMEKTFADVTLRMRPTATIGGDRLRLELDNRFGKAPVEVGHVSVIAGTAIVDATFDGRPAAMIPAGESIWTDPLDLRVTASEVVTVNAYLPQSTKYSTGNVWGAPFQVSEAGDFARSADFPAGPDEQLAFPDGNTIPLSAPLLRTIEVAGAPASAVLVCLGDSITVAGWPELSAALLPDQPSIAVLNRGIAGNRLRFDPMPGADMFGRAGVIRFDEDVVATAGVTHAVIALGTNDLGHPGTAAPLDQLPTAVELINAYGELIERANSAGIAVIVGTIPPFLPAAGYDDAREQIRSQVNEWVRESAPAMVDFDEALRAAADPTRLAEEYDSGDHLHPNAEGQARMARAMADTIARLSIH